MKKLILGSLMLGLILTFICGCNPNDDPSAIKIDKPVSMPLFYDNGGIRSSDSIYIQEKYFKNIKRDTSNVSLARQKTAKLRTVDNKNNKKNRQGGHNKR